MFESRPEKNQPVPRDPGQSVLSSAERRKLQQLFERGNQLRAGGDRDYANTVYAECVKRDPGNLIYVEAFLGNLQAKYPKGKRGGRLGALRKGSLKKAVARGDWRSVLATGIEMLESNPWDVPALRALAQACEALDFGAVELRYLKNALDAKPKDVHVNRHCGTSLARLGHFGQAIACWHRVEEASPKDKEAREMIAMLSTDTARQTVTGVRGPIAGRYQPRRAPHKNSAAAESAGELVTGAAESPRPEDDFELFLSLPPTSKLHALEQAIEIDPTEIGNYFQLASLHASEGRFELAEWVLAQASSVSPGDAKIHDAIEDLAIYQMRQKLVIAERRAAGQTDDRAGELADAIRSDLNRVELEVFAARCQRYPGRRDLNHQLGLRLKRARQFREAIEQFRTARTDPEHAASANIELGECLQHLRQFELAMKGYIQAAEQAAQTEHDELMKLALYRAGVLASAMGLTELAVDRLGMIVAMDPAYRDAASRLDKLQEIHDKG